MIGNTLDGLDNPDEAIFYTSGRTSNEAAFLYQLLVRMYGTNNMPDCSNMCHESSGAALTNTLGLGKGSVTLADFDKAEVIIVIGQNPGTNHPRMLTALEQAKRNGAKIVAVNPILEAGLLAFKNPQDVRDMITGATLLTDIYLQVKINGDLALFKCVLKLLVEVDNEKNKNVIDYQFIKDNTEGFEQLMSELNDYSVDELVHESGVSLSEINDLVTLLVNHKNIIICWAMGLTQHKNSVITIQEVINLLLLKGSIGRQGAGTCPVRGHSNVQGDRTMGIYEKPSQKLLDRLAEVFGFNPPQKHGLDTVNAIKAMYHKEAKVFIGMGGNFVSATPDTEYTATALKNCLLTVQVSTKLNRSHLIHGEMALILPTLGRTDQDIQWGGKQFVTVEDSMGVVHTSEGVLTPPSSLLLSEPAIIANIGKSIERIDELLAWDELIGNYDNIRNLIEKTIEGFDHYNVRVREENGFYLPNGPRDGIFTTENKKANFTINTLTPQILAKNELMMMTIRAHDQFNTTIYGLNDRYRGIYHERRVIMMNKEDIRLLCLVAYQVVNLYNHFEGIERVAERFIVVPYDIPRQCVATYFPEANVLVPINSVADNSNTPTSKSVVITISPLIENGKTVLAEVNAY